PKRFLQRRPDGDGWAWNLNGVRIVPYRLPALIAAVENGRPIYVAEGEKDVDNLVAIGFAATTNPMCAGSWRAEFAAYFHGADIIVIHDNDDHGRRHGQQIAANLAPVARRVRILDLLLDLPDLPPKGDASDWLAAGGNAAQLMKLAEAAPEWA